MGERFKILIVIVIMFSLYVDCTPCMIHSDANEVKARDNLQRELQKTINEVYIQGYLSLDEYQALNDKLDKMALDELFKLKNVIEEKRDSVAETIYKNPATYNIKINNVFDTN